MKKKLVLIIGKSKIALKHYLILKKIDSNFNFYFLDSNKKIWTYSNNNFLITKKNILINNNYFLVVICSPSNSHLNYIHKFINRSKFIFVEKPITNNLNSLIKFKKKISMLENYPKVLIGYNLRYSNSLIRFKKIILKNNFGKLLYVTSQVGMSLDLWRDKSLKLAASDKKKGGGAILELSHELDYLNWIFGPIKYVSSTINKIKKFKINVEENYFAILKTNKNSIINLSVDMVRCDPKRFCEAVFEKGTVFLDIINGTVRINKNKKNTIYKYKNDLENSYNKMWFSFFKNKENNDLKNLINSSIPILEVAKMIKKN